MKQEYWLQPIKMFHSAINCAASPQRNNISTIKEFTGRPPWTPIWTFTGTVGLVPVIVPQAPRESYFNITGFIKRLADLHMLVDKSIAEKVHACEITVKRPRWRTLTMETTFWSNEIIFTKDKIFASVGCGPRKVTKVLENYSVQDLNFKWRIFGMGTWKLFIGLA